MKKRQPSLMLRIVYFAFVTFCYTILNVLVITPWFIGVLHVHNLVNQDWLLFIANNHLLLGFTIAAIASTSLLNPKKYIPVVVTDKKK